jgi:hypothetical protein
MDASTLLWERWSAQVKELFPKIHGHQKKTLGLFVIGIDARRKCRDATSGGGYQFAWHQSSKNDEY